jgi:ribulose-phosphate 3-epimerase
MSFGNTQWAIEAFLGAFCKTGAARPPRNFYVPRFIEDLNSAGRSFRLSPRGESRQNKPLMAKRKQRKLRIAPSILSADFASLGAEVTAIGEAKADLIHIDVMDGHFVPNLTIGPSVVKALRPYSPLPFDCHLMIAPADPYIAAFAEAGADIISIHPEAGPHPHRTLQRIRSLGKKAGYVLNPGTPVEAVDPVFDLLDLILVMTVNPGFGGQTFIASQLPKISALRKRIEASGRDVMLEVDGGITPETAKDAVKAGADVLVAGSAVFKSKDYARNIASLRS